MASSSSSLLISPISYTTVENRDLCSNYAASFLRNSKLVFAARPRKSAASRRRGFRSPVAQKSYDNIHKQFRQENLKDGLMDNYKNTPQYLYGLTPSQMDMFMTEDSPVSREAEKFTEV